MSSISTWTDTTATAEPIASDGMLIVDACQDPPQADGTTDAPDAVLPHTAETETPTGNASTLAEPDVPAPQLNDVPMEGTPDALAAQLAHLIYSVGTVEELSRQAREAAVGDLARYEALVASSDQYRQGRDQAGAIRDQARQALDRAFGQAARSAAAALVDEAERVLAAFTQLVTAWQERAATFLAGHPDVELLVAERRVQDEEARRQEALAARMRRREALLADMDAALEQQVLPEARRALALFEREFPDEVDAIGLCRKRLQQTVRAEKDLAARQALLLAAEHQLRGELEVAVVTLEQVDVDGLSVDLSEDVFGRWCDTCSRLAQTTGAWLVRDAPTQGRGLILLKDPAHPHALQVFSSLGMGPDYPAGVWITPFLSDDERRDPSARRRAAAAPSILRRAREFRAATLAESASWGTFATTGSAAPVHH